MKVRYATDKGYVTGDSNEFVMTAPGYVTVYLGNDIEQVEINELEVQLSNKTWMSLTEAFNKKLVIENNLSTEFREPLTEAERIRGYYY